jgi:hypothetical protein
MVVLMKKMALAAALAAVVGGTLATALQQKPQVVERTQHFQRRFLGIYGGGGKPECSVPLSTQFENQMANIADQIVVGPMLSDLWASGSQRLSPWRAPIRRTIGIPVVSSIGLCDQWHSSCR